MNDSTKTIERVYGFQMRMPENMTIHGLKTRQRRDIRAKITTFQRVALKNLSQFHDVPEKLKSNVATFQRA